jgi:hypothetical protein
MLFVLNNARGLLSVKCIVWRLCRVRASAHLGSFCIKGIKEGQKNARYIE